MPAMSKTYYITITSIFKIPARSQSQFGDLRRQICTNLNGCNECSPTERIYKVKTKRTIVSSPTPLKVKRLPYGIYVSEFHTMENCFVVVKVEVAKLPNILQTNGITF